MHPNYDAPTLTTAGEARGRNDDDDDETKMFSDFFFIYRNEV